MIHPKTLRSDRAYTGSVVDLRVDVVQYPNGHTTTREVVEHPGGAVVVPVLDDGRILLIQQYRHPASAALFELPAGRLESSEPPDVCAARELQEETGYTTAKLTPLASMYTSPGICDEILHIYLAQHCTAAPDGQDLDAGESLLTVHPTSVAEIFTMIDTGKIWDGKTLTGLFLAFRKMEISE